VAVFETADYSKVVGFRMVEYGDGHYHTTFHRPILRDCVESFGGGEVEDVNLRVSDTDWDCEGDETM